MTKPHPGGSIFTFYSYKGGVGRTFALINVAALLSRWGHRVLCVDWDLEAPGLRYYLEEAERVQPLKRRPRGLVDWLGASGSEGGPDWREFVSRYEIPDGRHGLDVIPSDPREANYLEKLAALDWDELYAAGFGDRLERMRAEWKQEYDFVLVDSRTGVTDAGGVCAIQLPDFLVLFATANRQGLDGVAQFARDVDAERRDLVVSRGRMAMLPVLSSFAGVFEDDLGDEWSEKWLAALGPFFSPWLHRDVSPERILPFTRVPLIPRWAFGENLPVLEETEHDPENISYAFANLAALVAHRLSRTDQLVDHRQEYLRQARNGVGGAAGTDIRVRHGTDATVTSPRPPERGPRRAFVIWDFETEGVRSTLQYVSRRPPAGVASVFVSGYSISVGEIWRDVVEKGLKDATFVLALVDLPNANVGYEIGYALGLGKPLRLAWAGERLPAWVGRPPFTSHVIDRGRSLDEVRALLAAADALPLPTVPERGEEVLLLGPNEGEGQALVETALDLKPDWRTLPGEGWTLKDLPEQLRGVGRVVWVVAPFHSERDRRDGQENAAAAVVAGFAEAHGVPVEVLQHARARKVVDVAHRAKAFADLKALEPLVRAIGAPARAKADVVDAYRLYVQDVHGAPLPFFGGKGVLEVYVELMLARRRGEEGARAPEDAVERARALAEAREHRSAWTLQALVEDESNEGGPARLVVLGDPGAGKSTALRRLAYELGASDDGPVPVLVHLGVFAGGDVHPFALAEQDLRATRIGANADGLATRLHRLAKEGRVWLLFDGLDEVDKAGRARVRHRLRALGGELGRCPIVVTSREAGYEPMGDGFDEAKILPLARAQQEKLLRRWLGAEVDAAALLDSLPPRVRTLAPIPLFLTLLAKIHLDERRLPRSRTELYRQAVDLLLKHGFAEEPKPVIDPWAAGEILPGWCLELQKQPKLGWSEDEVNRALRASLQRDPERKELLKDTWGTQAAFVEDVSRRAGVVGPHDGPDAPWRFLHRSFQEFLAARALAALDDEARTAFLGELGDDVARWGETFGLLCDLLPDDAARLALLGELKERDDELALRTLGQVQHLEPRQVLGLLESLEGWDGDALAELLRGWLADGHEPDDVWKVVVGWVEEEWGRERQAYALYALETSGVVEPADEEAREVFLERCGLGREQRKRPEIRRVALPPEGGTATFRMGSVEGVGDDDERPRHEVTLSPFAIGVTTVTREEYAAFDDGHECPGGSKHPVTRVSWWRAWLFSRWIGGSLPTEAQWEYACRAGADGENDLWCFGGDEQQLSRYAWYGEGVKGKPHPVAKKKPNGFGLFDMHGNVWEWCADWIGAYPHESADLADPTGPDRGTVRVLRGGAAWNVAVRARSAFRFRRHPGLDWSDNVGFRVAFPSPAPRSRESKLDS